MKPKLTKEDRREQQARIDKAFYRLERICETAHDWDKYLREQTASERRHQRGVPAGLKSGITVAKAARMFAVLHIIDARLGEPCPPGTAILSTRIEVFMAHALYAQFKTKIDMEFGLEEALALREIDYARHAQP